MADELNSKSVCCLAISVLCTCCAVAAVSHAATMDGRKAFSFEEIGRTHAQVGSAKAPEMKRGGRFVVGKPYVVKGKRYYPKEEPSYDRSGVASWYGAAFQGRRTANGETYDADYLSAAHPTLPLPSYVRVTNLESGASVIVRVNDRGPFHEGRLIDLSSRAADVLDLKRRGTAFVRVQYVGRPGLGGDDMAFLVASHVKEGQRSHAFGPKPQIDSRELVAFGRPSDDRLQSARAMRSAMRKAAGAYSEPGPGWFGGTNASLKFGSSQMSIEVGGMVAGLPLGRADGRNLLQAFLDVGRREKHMIGLTGGMPRSRPFHLKPALPIPTP